MRRIILAVVAILIFLLGVGALRVYDDINTLDSESVTDDVFAIFGLGSTDKEPFQRQDPAWRLDPFVVDGTAHCGHVHANLVGDLLHLQRLDRLWPVV